MAGLKSFLQPSIEENLEQLDLQASEMSPPTPGFGDYASRVFENGLRDNLFVSLGNYAYDRLSGQDKLSEQDLEMLHPDVPPETFKGGMSAFQAEIISDRMQRQLEAVQLREMISTNTGGHFEPRTYAALEMVGMGAQLASGFVDPINLGMGYGMGKLVTLATPMTKSFLPSVYKTVASSRLSSNVTREITENVMGDLAITYPLQRTMLDEFNRQEESLQDMMLTAIGGGAVFGTLRSFGKTRGLVDQAVKSHMSEGGDKINAAVNSDVMNAKVTEEALKSAVMNTDPETKQSINKAIAKKVFASNPEMSTDTGAGTFYGAYETNTLKSDYIGRRYGDTHIFIDNQSNINNMVDLVNNDGQYKIMAYEPTGKTIDLDSSKALEHPDILRIIDEEMPYLEWNKIQESLGDDATLADIFHKISEFDREASPSGFDYVEMFDKINEKFESQGFTATRYNEPDGNHSVLSVFKDSLDETTLSELEIRNGKNTGTIVDPNQTSRSTEFTDMDGKTHPTVEPIEFDNLYDTDPEISMEIKRLNDSITEVKQEYDAQTEVSKIADELAEDLKATENMLKQDNINTNEIGKVKEEVDLVRKDIENTTPEKISEITKATENCLRKG